MTQWRYSEKFQQAFQEAAASAFKCSSSSFSPFQQDPSPLLKESSENLRETHYLYCEVAWDSKDEILVKEINVLPRRAAVLQAFRGYYPMDPRKRALYIDRMMSSASEQGLFECFRYQVGSGLAGFPVLSGYVVMRWLGDSILPHGTLDIYPIISRRTYEANTVDPAWRQRLLGKLGEPNAIERSLKYADWETIQACVSDGLCGFVIV